MKKDPKLTDEHLKRVSPDQKTKTETKEDILFRTEELTKQRLKERNKKKEEEIFELTGGGQTSIRSLRNFNKILLKNPVIREVTFVKEFYDHLYRLTGLPRSESNPHYKPDVFAEYTIKYIYGRFNIKNLLPELRDRNPYITAESMREFKHYHYFNEESYNRLLGFISEFMSFAKGFEKLHEFDIAYCKKYNLTTDGDIFYND